MYLNKAILIGNLTRDPEVKSLPSGITIKFTLTSIYNNNHHFIKNNSNNNSGVLVS
jgi:single-stranded DNA-binding protein